MRFCSKPRSREIIRRVPKAFQFVQVFKGKERLVSADVEHFGHPLGQIVTGNTQRRPLWPLPQERARLRGLAALIVR
jgi:hypothetical protein